MPILQLAIKFTEPERALLKKRAKKHGLTEADYLRMAMSFEAFTAGDPDAISILGKKLRQKLWPAFVAELANAPVKA